MVDSDGKLRYQYWHPHCGYSSQKRLNVGTFDELHMYQGGWSILYRL